MEDKRLECRMWGYVYVLGRASFEIKKIYLPMLIKLKIFDLLVLNSFKIEYILFDKKISLYMTTLTMLSIHLYVSKCLSFWNKYLFLYFQTF